MSIRYAILGFLSWKPFTGYELKKLFADALSFHWSGNNNQIYGSLVELRRDGAVTIEVLQQEKLPARKVYTITDGGREELRSWLVAEPELPVVRSMAHTRLAWADCLPGPEFEGMLAAYERLLAAQVLMCGESTRRGAEAPAGSRAPARTPREELLWKSIEARNAAFYEGELAWIRSLRRELAELAQDGTGRTT
jgi:PadR family transcriptional regulator AphA